MDSRLRALCPFQGCAGGNKAKTWIATPHKNKKRGAHNDVEEIAMTAGSSQ